MFFGEYLYKLVLANSLNHIFRTERQKDNNLSYARAQLDELTSKYMQGDQLTKTVFRTNIPIDPNEFLDAKDIYTVLKNKSEYKIRAEHWKTFTIYSKDKSTLTEIIKTMRVSLRELWEPDPSHVNLLLSNENILIVDSPPEFAIRVTLGSQDMDPLFANWLEANTDKSRVGSTTLRAIRNKLKLNGFYFYVRDEKILGIVDMLIGHNIRRIDKLVYKANVDKY